MILACCPAPTHCTKAKITTVASPAHMVTNRPVSSSNPVTRRLMTKKMYPPVAMAVPMVANSDSKNIDQPMKKPSPGPTARRPYANGPPANGIATDSSDRHNTQAMYKAQTNKEAKSMPIGPPSLSPGFQPKYSPVMTTPTPN